MNALLTEQGKLLHNSAKLHEMSPEELAGYAQRNERISQLCKELGELE
jgi:hypothetical protein